MTKAIITPKELFSTALRRAESEGIVSDLYEIAPEVYKGTVDETWGSIALCRDLAKTLPGMGFPSRSQHGGCTWRNGRTFYGALVDPNNLPNLYVAQGIAEGIVGYENSLRWSMGSVARSLLNWVRPEQKSDDYTPDAERLLEGIQYGYHECKPGEYKYVEYHDVSAYYFNMLQRVPHLKCYIGPKVIDWDKTGKDVAEMERFRHVLNTIKDLKPLRNVMAGVMAGPTHHWDGTPNYSVFKSRKTGKVCVKVIPWQPGKFRAIGLLLVRSGSELTQLQCMRLGDECIYANIDCAFTQGSQPDLWQEYGFRTKVNAVGDAELFRRGSYRVGDYITKPFAAGYREVVPAERAALPRTLYAPQWL